MIGFLWFLVIMIIVVRYLDAAKANGRRSDMAGKQPGAPRAQGKWTSQAPRQPGNAAYGQPAQPKNGSYPQAARTNDRRYAMPARPVQSSAYPVKKQEKTENSILQKAKANASEHFDSDALEQRGAAKLDRVPQGSEIMKDKALERHIHSEHKDGHETELRNRPGVDDLDTYHLVEEVNDLIVKGYSGNLEFERDFLAEGTDMLNRISM